MNASGWSAAELVGKAVLECGSGAGRFTEVLCETGAQVTSVDISSAVHANAASNGHFPRLRLVQASIYALPFPEESFDFLFCCGVIQHTPDVEKTFKTLFRYLRPGGRFCIDVYAAIVAYPHPRQLLRPITKHVPPAKLYALVEKAVPKLLPLSMKLSAVPWAGQCLARLIPVANHRYLGVTDERPPGAGRCWTPSTGSRRATKNRRPGDVLSGGHRSWVCVRSPSNVTAGCTSSAASNNRRPHVGDRRASAGLARLGGRLLSVLLRVTPVKRPRPAGRSHLHPHRTPDDHSG
ncbi:class I SAM-dependent methyltransferase [Streptosporangium amethystogenes subsp. fukuiense]|uniref:Class I SAM-dependent methyltransferase n=1 Tax=Streptosporangium amethystogenes subsp. fukuiense TaxID=698418 RepID=A0ABW2SSK6_9ACTN